MKSQVGKIKWKRHQKNLPPKLTFWSFLSCWVCPLYIDQAPHDIALDAPHDQKRGAHNWVLGSKMVCKWSESNQNGPNAHEMQWIKFIMLKNGPWDLDWVQSIFGFLFVFFTWSDPDKSFKIIPRLCKWLPTHVLDKLHAGQRDHWEGGFMSPDLWWFVFLSHRKSWHVTRIIH